MNTVAFSWPFTRSDTSFGLPAYPWLSKVGHEVLSTIKEWLSALPGTGGGRGASVISWPNISSVGPQEGGGWLSWGIGRIASDTSGWISRIFGPWPITSTTGDPTCPPDPILSTDPTDGLPFKVSADPTDGGFPFEMSADPSTPSRIMGPGIGPILQKGPMFSGEFGFSRTGPQEGDPDNGGPSRISRIFDLGADFSVSGPQEGGGWLSRLFSSEPVNVPPIPGGDDGLIEGDGIV